MLFPIGDDNSDRTITPFVNYGLIVVNILVFIFLQSFGSDLRFTYGFSTVPQEIVTGTDITTPNRVVQDPATGDVVTLPGLQATPLWVYLTLLTSMFMHGGFAHIAGNMLYLFIFGDNLENLLGHARYLAFYLLAGILASLAHVFSTAALGGDMLVPSLGASGAISGVLGGYLLMFPRRRVRVLIVRMVTEVPAIAAIGLWFLFQLVSGLGMLGGGAGEGGVAYAAHIGGFVAGLTLVKLFAAGAPAA